LPLDNPPRRDIAETIGKGLKVPVTSLSPEEAQAHFGWLSVFAGNDLAASGAKTRKKLGWNPTGPGLIADLERMRYPEVASDHTYDARIVVSRTIKPTRLARVQRGLLKPNRTTNHEYKAVVRHRYFLLGGCPSFQIDFDHRYWHIVLG
jgi:hypothetical protein